MSSHGSERADVTRGRAVPPRDDQVERLTYFGYSGKRPATTAELRRLLNEWRPSWCSIKLGDIRQVSRLPANRRTEGIAVLRAKIREEYDAAVGRAEKPGANSEKGKRKILARMEGEYDGLMRVLAETPRRGG